MLQTGRFPYRPDVNLTAYGTGGGTIPLTQFLFAACDSFLVSIKIEAKSIQNSFDINPFDLTAEGRHAE